MKKCILSVPYYERLGDIIQDMLLCDSSIHGTLFRIICTTKQSLEVSHVLSLLILLIHEKLYF